MPDAVPKLRGEIDAAPVTRDGETFYILYDRSGVSGARLLLSPLGLLIAGRLDGAESILELSDALSREMDSPVSCSEIGEVVAALDEAVFLDGVRYQDFYNQAARDFRDAPLRPAASAGSAYADDPHALARDLDRMMAEAPPPETSPSGLSRPPRGVIAPHLDYARGEAGYGQCYRALAALPPPRTVVVVGTAHLPLRERFSLCDKDFDTPLGAMRVDRELAEKLRRAARPHADLERDVLAHRGEHSIELQAVWLRHVYGDAVRIVPLLAGTLGDFLGGERDAAAAADPLCRALADCLAEAAESDGVMIMASADLSHVGPRFGDSREVTNRFLAEVEEADRSYLAAVSDGALPGLKNLAGHGDRHHVCGSACIFALGLALPGAKTTLLGYHQAATPEMRQAVTYASMFFA